MTIPTKQSLWRTLLPTLAAWVLAFGYVFGSAAAVAAEELRAALLTQELGDPRAPGNIKLVVNLPDPYGNPLNAVSADDFDIYVYPAHFDRNDGVQERFLASGVYLWRNGARFFLDARVVPTQDEEGPATVRVIYRPDRNTSLEGVAEGVCRYAADLVDVVLAVDISRSMVYNDPNKLRVAAARSFIETAREAGGIGRIGLVTFNHNATNNTPLLPLDQGEQLLAVLDRVGAAGMTNLDKPIDLALAELSGSRRPVLVLLTDGKNEGSEYQNTHLKAVDAGLRIFSVGLSEQTDHRLLREMADVTGGMYSKAVRDSDLPDIYARLAAELGKRQLLHATVLTAENGFVSVPIDASVRRLAALTDGGARLRIRGPGAGMGGTGESSRVHFGKPAAGEWDFTWERAVPGVSVLALSADTGFFLDVFPPQLRGGILSVGATLAEGDTPLGESRIWVEPIPGIIPERILLHDDGRHGDGQAGDGVYSGAVMLGSTPDQFDMVVRADGAAWDYGDFVRQAAALAIRSREPPPGHAELDGDIDFGVLFPGETGSARVDLDLDSRTPRELYLELEWQDDGAVWPTLASRMAVEPGRHQFEIEMTVPAEAHPGDYTGNFVITDNAELGDSSAARLRVGTVTFEGGELIDLGDVPPGTFRSRNVTIPYHADKDARLQVTLAAGEELDVNSVPETLPEGDGVVQFEVVVSTPMGQADGEHSGTIILEAGPGRIDIPVRWRTRPYQAKPREVVPPAGIPDAPDLPEETRPLERTPDLSGDFWTPDIPSSLEETGPSPWEQAEKAFTRTPRVTPAAPGAGSGVSFPNIEQPRGGDSFWSAWWLYILAALLLLLLLLLLLAYLLYRLGKSALARFLLVSAIANLILLIIFILLLGTSGAVAPRLTPDIVVSLVDDEPPVTVSLSDAERDLLTDSRSTSQDGRKGVPSEAVLSEAEASASASSSGSVTTEKTNAVLENADDESAQLADNLQPAAASFEAERDDALSRRERQRERELSEQPVRDLPEMAEPPVELARANSRESNASAEDRSEAKLDLLLPDESERPVWSDGVRPLQPMTSTEGSLVAAAPGMEAVSFDRTVRRIDPRGHRRSLPESMVTEPEPRVEIDDPARDREGARLAERPDAPDGEPGVEELRVDNLAMGMDIYGHKPGSAMPAGVTPIRLEPPSRLARGVSGHDVSEASLPRGGLRAARGTGKRDGAATGAPSSGDMPGGAGAPKSTAIRDGGTGRASSTGDTVNEKRFDALPSGGGSKTGLADATGLSTSSHIPVGGGDGARPSVASGNAGERAAFTPSRQSGSGESGEARDGPSRQSDGRSSTEHPGRNDSGNPDTLASGGVPGMPDGLDDTSLPADGARAGETSRTGGRGLGLADNPGEGRVDEMASGPGKESLATRPGTDFHDLHESELDDRNDRYRLNVIPMDSTASAWTRLERGSRRRSVSVASSSVDLDSLLIVVGDFSRLPDSASENLFETLSGRIRSGITVQERRLSPGDVNLHDTLLALLTPEEMRDWSDSALGHVGDYLKQGGHIWLDSRDRPGVRRQMERLADAVGGEFGPLPSSHPLRDGEEVDAVTVNGRELVVATYQDWRPDWRYGERNGRAFRFLTRSLNYFLSGDADDGIVVGPGRTDGTVIIEPTREIIPELLAGGDGGDGILWDEFGPGTAAAWRMPSWSDPGAITAISDGQGGRALKMDLRSARKGRAAVYRTLTPPEDFSVVRYVSLETYYDGMGKASLSMVFTVDNGDGWVDYETPALDLQAGWNRLRFDLDSDDFRPLQPDENDDGRLRDSDRTGRAGFFLYREGEAPALVLYRNIRVHE